jgi:putative ABC transport system permease protein
MLRNYLKLSLRNLAKNSVYSAIIISGLTLAFGCCLITMLFVMEETSFDKQSPDSHRIFRVAQNFVNADGTIIPDATTPAAIAPLIAQDIAAVESIVRIYPAWGSRLLVRANDKSFYESRLWSADSSLFSLFSLEVISGDPARTLTQKQGLVITESLGKKYFGDDDPVGKTMSVIGYRDSIRVVGAVIKDLPRNMHFHFDMVEPIYVPENPEDAWNYYNYYTYIKLHEGAAIADVEPLISDVFRNHRPGRTNQYFTQPLTDIHLRSELKWELENNGSETRVIIFITVGLFILLIAAVNYINLSIVQSLTRAKEVGIRKVSGAQSKELIQQFLQESLLISLASLVAAILLVQFSRTIINVVFGQELRSLFALPALDWVLIVACTLLVAFLSGMYPALYLSAFKPSEVLKGMFQPTGRSLWLRKALVVFQFAISIALITGAIVVFKQVNYMRAKDLGFNNDQVLVIRNAGDVRHKSSFKEAVRSIPGVQGIASSSGLIGGQNWTTQVKLKGSEFNSQINFTTVDHDYPEVMGVEFVAGRTFDKDRDRSDKAEKIIINERAVQDLGIEGDPIGVLISDRSDVDSANVYREIVGVVKDFHYTTLRSDIKPYGFYLFEGAEVNFLLKVSTTEYQDLLKQLKQTWSSFSGGRPFEYTFLDEQFQMLFKDDENFRMIFLILTAISIYIACSGLFAVASFFIRRRTKEIGIRKVLGASVSQVTWLVSNRFLSMVLFANILAWPATYLFMEDWLSGFAYRIEMDWTIYLSASFIAVLIAAITIGGQSIRAASGNPVTSLRTE